MTRSPIISVIIVEIESEGLLLIIPKIEFHPSEMQLLSPFVYIIFL
jgi:hypothetical protein